jgi:hypothetical protein
MKIVLGLHPQKIVKSTGVFEEMFVVPRNPLSQLLPKQRSKVKVLPY